MTFVSFVSIYLCKKKEKIVAFWHLCTDPTSGNIGDAKKKGVFLQYFSSISSGLASPPVCLGVVVGGALGAVFFHWKRSAEHPPSVHNNIAISLRPPMNGEVFALSTSLSLSVISVLGWVLWVGQRGWEHSTSIKPALSFPPFHTLIRTLLTKMSLRRACLCGKTAVMCLREGSSTHTLSLKPAEVSYQGAADVRRYEGRVFCGVCGDHIAQEKLQGGTPAVQVMNAISTPSPGLEAARKTLRRIAPPLDGSRHKGQGGRLGVLGGSEVYTGAPYFAGMAGLRVGAELVYMMVPAEAATTIKGYSPELMVRPLYCFADGTPNENINAADGVARIRAQLEETLPRLHALVIGPGWGTNPNLVALLSMVFDLLAVRTAKTPLPVVIDADGLRALPQLKEQAKRLCASKVCLVLTPNARELRLFDEVADGEAEAAQRVAAELGCIVVVKGGTDLVATPDHIATCTVEGAPRRVGGLGDLLSGTLGVVLGWRFAEGGVQGGDALTMEACTAACAVVRHASSTAFTKKHRSMSALDVLEQIGAVSEELCPAHL